MTRVSKRSLKRKAGRGLGASALITAALALPLSFGTAAHADAPDKTDNKLTAGEVLKPAESVKSRNGQYKLIQQSQGNLVLYGPGNKAMWATPTSGAPAYATMQREGNLVIYNSAKQPLWSTNTAGNPGAYLTVQDDGNLVIYSADNRFLWSRHAYVGSLPSGHTLKTGQWVQSPNGAYKLLMQKEGNLVLYARANKALWTTPTANQPGASATMQKEGNLVIYNASKQGVWTTKTAGNSGAYLAVQNQGNIVIYSKDGKALWSAG
ncbi:hypothetical protein [Microtetraspora niveoalba]|uniref:hypothetical protein n=1 Tax=Microtetraspora niveoalba TaxID=46175 RepID=UPI0008379141|nr:hypothetical protein [Microtetraspora niveoalba]